MRYRTDGFMFELNYPHQPGNCGEVIQPLSSCFLICKMGITLFASQRCQLRKCCFIKLVSGAHFLLCKLRSLCPETVISLPFVQGPETEVRLRPFGQDSDVSHLTGSEHISQATHFRENKWNFPHFSIISDRSPQFLFLSGKLRQFNNFAIILGLNPGRSGFHPSSLSPMGAPKVWRGFHSIELLGIGNGSVVVLGNCRAPPGPVWPLVIDLVLYDSHHRLLCVLVPNHQLSGTQASLTAEIWNRGSFWKFFRTFLGPQETVCVYASVQTFLATVFVICSFCKACSFLGLP